MYFLSLCLFSFLMLIVQVTLFDLLLHGIVVIELTMILVIYAGFHLDATRGGILTFMIGLLYDAIAGIIPGLFIVVYMLIFCVAKVISDKVRVENSVLIMGFTCMSTFLEGVMIFFVYGVLLDIHLSKLLFVQVFVPQAVILSALSPLLFSLFHRIEVLTGVGESQ